jgi:hypothetical protein
MGAGGTSVCGLGWEDTDTETQTQKKKEDDGEEQKEKEWKGPFERNDKWREEEGDIPA